MRVISIKPTPSDDDVVAARRMSRILDPNTGAPVRIVAERTRTAVPELTPAQQEAEKKRKEAARRVAHKVMSVTLLSKKTPSALD